MVVPFAEFDLFVVGLDSRADFGRITKIKRSSFDVLQFARRNQARVHRREFVGIHAQHILQNVSTPRPGKIEIRVIGEVDDGLLVGRRGIVDLQFILVR